MGGGNPKQPAGHMLPLQELGRVTKDLVYIRDKLSLVTAVDAEITSGDSTLNATLVLDQGFYSNMRISVSFAKSEKDVTTFSLQNYPITEFQSILSVVCPLIPKFQYFESNARLLTRAITRDAIDELRMCEQILTVRKFLTNSDCYPDWDAVAFEGSPPTNVFVSVFPFRDALYVTVCRVRDEPELPICEMRDGSSPFALLPKRVIQIKERRYSVVDSIVAKQSQQFLGQTLRWLRVSIEALEGLASIKPNKAGGQAADGR
jgi:hypothetical protein